MTDKAKAFELHGYAFKYTFKYDYCIKTDRDGKSYGGTAVVGTTRDNASYVVAEEYLDLETDLIKCYDCYGTLGLTTRDKHEAMEFAKRQAKSFVICADAAPELLSDYKRIK